MTKCCFFYLFLSLQREGERSQSSCSQLWRRWWWRLAAALCHHTACGTASCCTDEGTTATAAAQAAANIEGIATVHGLLVACIEQSAHCQQVSAVRVQSHSEDRLEQHVDCAGTVSAAEFLCQHRYHLFEQRWCLLLATMPCQLDGQSAGGAQAGQAAASFQRCCHLGTQAQEEEEHQSHLPFYDGGH